MIERFELAVGNRVKFGPNFIICVEKVTLEGTMFLILGFFFFFNI
jgi:hypothetical protein